MEFSTLSALIFSALIGGFGGQGLVYLSEKLSDYMHKDKSINVSLHDLK